MSPQVLHLSDVHLARAVCGERDAHLRQIEKAFGIEVLARGTDLTFQGKAKACQLANRVIRELYALVQKGFPIAPRDVAQAVGILQNDPGQVLADIFLDSVGKSMRGVPITPRTSRQKQYVSAIRDHDIVFAWGPAGTGKTYLAMAMAVSALHQKQVDRIILTRPAVEAGEKLGFLPGDLAEKVNPYLRPLYDALHDMMEFEKAQKLLQAGQIEVAPLAFMRGRTLSHSFVILDEAQNSTPEQMKMFLTRLGAESKAVITGDITQVDLPDGKGSGLVQVLSLLQPVEGIAFVEFTERDVMRHPLVRKILLAYDSADRSRILK